MASIPQHIPYQGHFIGHEHRFAVRVYYEDTDFSGVVYHARYLHFMERARSDMLARIGIDQRAVHAADEGTYVVADMMIKYRAPAQFDDALLVTSTVKAVRAASCSIRQIISRDGKTLTDALVTAAFVAPNGRPKRQPKNWLDAFQSITQKGNN
jgi:acyl-CoA thioester hydrolase